jgi:hypothetical protein
VLGRAGAGERGGSEGTPVGAVAVGIDAEFFSDDVIVCTCVAVVDRVGLVAAGTTGGAFFSPSGT